MRLKWIAGALVLMLTGLFGLLMMVRPQAPPSPPVVHYPVAAAPVAKAVPAKSRMVFEPFTLPIASDKSVALVDMRTVAVFSGSDAAAEISEKTVEIRSIIYRTTMQTLKRTTGLPVCADLEAGLTQAVNQYLKRGRVDGFAIQFVSMG